MEFNEFRNEVIKNRELHKDFFNPNSYHVTDIRKLKNVQIAASKIRNHINDKSSIVIYADVDIDGVSATVIAYEWLLSQGANVTYVHHGKHLGHGVIPSFVPQCDLLIVVDSTSSNTDKVKELLDNDTIKDCIIIDHHEIDGTPIFDIRITLVNPYQEGCEYENKDISGALLTWRVMDYTEKRYMETKSIHNFLYLAAMSIVSDSMDVSVMENRYFYYAGNMFDTPAFQAIDSYSKTYSSKSLALSVNTKLNSAIRNDEMQLVFDFLLTKELKMAEAILKELENIYKSSKAGVKEAIDTMVTMYKNDKIIIGQSDYPHRGYLAGRVSSYTNKNVIVLSFDYKTVSNKKVYYGSARAVDGVDLKDVVSKVSNAKCVGHQQAFGVNVTGVIPFLNGVKKLDIPEPVKRFDYVIDVDSLSADDVAYGAYCNFLTGNGYDPITYTVKGLIISSIGQTGSGNKYFNDEKNTRYSQYNNKWLSKYKVGDAVDVIGSITNETYGNTEIRVFMVNYIQESSEDIWEI